jgi:hypothetical protein
MRRISMFGTILLCGCGNLFNQHAQMMDAMRGVMSDTAARLGESGTGQIAAGGHVINPGIHVSGGVEYYAEARYEGVSGQVQASMSGQLNRAIPQQVQDRIDAIWRDGSLAAEQKLKLIEKALTIWLAQPSQSQSPATQPVEADDAN